MTLSSGPEWWFCSAYETGSICDHSVLGLSPGVAVSQSILAAMSSKWTFLFQGNVRKTSSLQSRIQTVLCSACWRINKALQSFSVQALRPGREPGPLSCHNTAAVALTCTHTVSHNPIFGVWFPHCSSTTLNEWMDATANLSVSKIQGLFLA